MLRRVALKRTDVLEEQRLHHSIVFILSVRRLLITANVIPSAPILVILMMETLSSSETSVLTRVTRRNIPEDGIRHSHSRENLKSYIALTGWTL
jgi:predicted hotdog family 3-hydroxylacyl-ACP dehydratase